MKALTLFYTVLFLGIAAQAEVPQYLCKCELNQYFSGELLAHTKGDVICPKGHVGEVRCLGYRVGKGFYQECGLGEFGRPNRDETYLDYYEHPQIFERITCELSLDFDE